MALPNLQVMKLTDAASNRVRALMEKSDSTSGGLRIGVKNGGCAGMSYTMDFVENPEPFDEKVEDKGVTVYIESKAVLFLLGTEMDYEVSDLSAGFVFKNPNQTSACGCGESVAITPASAELLNAGRV